MFTLIFIMFILEKGNQYIEMFLVSFFCETRNTDIPIQKWSVILH